MVDERIFSDNEIEMQCLCEELESMKEQFQKLRRNQIQGRQVMSNLQSIESHLLVQIKELERLGLKRPVIKPADPVPAKPVNSPLTIK